MIPNVIRDLTSGIPGTVAFTGPSRVKRLKCVSTTPENLEYGRAFTYDASNPGIAKPGTEGGGAIAGILIDPMLTSDENGLLPSGEMGNLLTMGPVWVKIKIGQTWVPGDDGGV